MERIYNFLYIYSFKKFFFGTFVLFLSSLQVETEAKPITNQKSSGRCWNFATLNVIRIPFMKQHNLEEFEFSQAYLFFWDKVKSVCGH